MTDLTAKDIQDAVRFELAEALMALFPDDVRVQRLYQRAQDEHRQHARSRGLETKGLLDIES